MPKGKGVGAAGGLRIAFLHLDLGIGGAEQLVVNAAVALQQKGHHVTIFTTHHDPGHCFAETRGSGPLASTVRVYGDWLPRHILGRFTALCAFVRMIYLAFVVGMLSALSPSQSWDLTFCDGVSAMIPILRLFCLPVLFYCHYPDKLLCTDRRSLFKRLYRAPLDWLEEITTGFSSAIAVNSRFTAGVFKEAFTRIGGRFDPVVLYPAINLDSFVGPRDKVKDDDPVGPITSLNRFERKKNVGLAIEAFAIVKKRLEDGVGGPRRGRSGGGAPAWTPQLVVAGGYDEAVRENVEHLQELRQKAEELGVSDMVSFRTSIPDQERATLLQDSLCVVYTPDKEHFGIVPLEAMYAGTPVLAVASGGPLETIVDRTTGFLCPGEPEAFADALWKLVSQPGLKRSMGVQGHGHVKDKFSLDAFAKSLDEIVRTVGGDRGKAKGKMLWVLLFLVAVGAAVGAAVIGQVVAK